MSEPIKDGGPAFPKTITAGDKSISEGGLSIRDYFAGQALAGLLTQPAEPEFDGHFAAASYQMADAMLKARAVK